MYCLCVCVFAGSLQLPARLVLLLSLNLRTRKRTLPARAFFLPLPPAVVHTPRGLQRLVAGEAAYLQLPVLLQQYVDHGGCLFKVYVLGDTSGE